MFTRFLLSSGIALCAIQIAWAQNEPLPKNLTPESNIPVAAPDIPMAKPDVPMQGAPSAPAAAQNAAPPATSRLIHPGESPAPAQATTQGAKPDLQPPVTLQSIPVKRSSKFIEVTELPPVEESGGDDAATADAPMLPDPNAPADLNTLPVTNYLHVTLFGINKIVARSEEISGKIGEVIRFKNLEIIAHRCQSIVDDGEQGFAALLEIREMQKSDTEKPIFQGWLFSTSPSINSLEHPLYDIGVKSCEESQAVSEKTEHTNAPKEEAPETKN